MPVLLSSPDAVQETVIVLFEGLESARSETAAGAVVSAIAVVAKLGTFEIAEVLGTSSEVLRAK